MKINADSCPRCKRTLSNYIISYREPRHFESADKICQKCKLSFHFIDDIKTTIFISYKDFTISWNLKDKTCYVRSPDVHVELPFIPFDFTDQQFKMYMTFL